MSEHRQNVRTQVSEVWALRFPDGRLLHRGFSDRALTSAEDVRRDFAPDVVEIGEPVLVRRTTTQTYTYPSTQKD